MNVASKDEFVGGQSEWEEGARQAREEAVQPSCEIVGISKLSCLQGKTGRANEWRVFLILKVPPPLPSFSSCLPAKVLWRVGKEMSILPATERTVLCRSGFSKETEPIGYMGQIDRFILRIWLI